MTDSTRAAMTRFVARDGQRLSYEAHGEPGGPSLLGLHDLLADRGQLRSVAAMLAPVGYRVILPDARGHGASPTISGRSFPTSELAADALAVLDAEELSSPAVLAAGWSAAAALELAVRAPARVRALVLVEPYLPVHLAAYAEGEARDVGTTQRRILEAAIGAGERGQLDRSLDLLFGARVGEGWREQMPKPAQTAARRHAVNLASLLSGSLAAPRPPGDLAALAVPVSIFVPVDAVPIDQLTSGWLTSVIPHARIETSPAASDAERLRTLVAEAVSPS